MTARRLTVAMLYLLVSLGVFALWARLTELEVIQEKWREWTSITYLIDGKTGKPFVGRRLLADGAYTLSLLMPEELARSFVAISQGDSLPGRILRAFLVRGWSPDRYPELLAAYFLIWLSILGFMLTCRWLVTLCYEAPPWMADLIGLLFGVLLLGGNGREWGSYPYDFPQAFVFTLTLGAILGSRWWLIFPFALACYSKETSVLLIPAYAMVNRDRYRNWRFWAQFVLMAGIYILLRSWIAWRYRDEPFADPFWFPGRNAMMLFKAAIFYVWMLLPGLILLVRFGHFLRRHELPRHLLPVLLMMACVLFGAGFFKGWLEERRQYLEMLALAGLIVCQWTVAELGLERFLRARPAG